jgi:hypothetical protein
VSLDAPLPALPPGVELGIDARTPGTLQPYHALIHAESARSYIWIINRSATPLYVLVDRAGLAAASPSASIKTPATTIDSAPYGWVPIQFARADQAFIWSYHGYDNDGPGEWLNLGSGIPVTDGGFGLSPGFQDRLERANDRPGDVAIPSPQPAGVRLTSAGRVLTVPFTVTYSLNQTYDPRRGHCPNFEGNWLFGLLCLVSLAMVAGAVGLLVIVALALRPKAPA